MKRTSKQLLSVLLAIVLVIGLAAPALGAASVMDEAVETPVAEEQAPQAETPRVVRQQSAQLAEVTWTGTTSADGKSWNANSETTNGTVVVPANEAADIVTVAGVTLHVDGDAAGWKVSGNTPAAGDEGYEKGFEPATNGGKFRFVVSSAATGKVLRIVAKGPNKVMHLTYNDVALTADEFKVEDGYIINGEINTAETQRDVIHVTNIVMKEGTYAFWADGSKERLYGFDILDEKEKETFGFTIGNRWYAPAKDKIPSDFDVVNGGVATTVAGVTLTLGKDVHKDTGVAGAGWGYSGGDATTAAAGYMYGLVATQNANGSATAIPTTGAYFQFTAGQDVAAGTTVELVLKVANNKKYYLLDGDNQAPTFTSEISGAINTDKTLTDASYEGGLNPVTVTFTVEAGKTYYFSGNGTKPVLYSFKVSGEETADPTLVLSAATVTGNAATEDTAAAAQSVAAMTNQAAVYAVSEDTEIATVEVNGFAVTITPGTKTGATKVYVAAAEENATGLDTVDGVKANATYKTISVTVTEPPVVVDDPTLWVARQDNLSALGIGDKPDVAGTALTAETEVPLTGKLKNGTEYTVAGVKLYVGAEAYKFTTASDMGDGSGSQSYLVGNATNPTPNKGDTPTAGCYYKFVASENGVLETETILNSAKALWVICDGTYIADGITVGVKSLRADTVVMKAGQTAYIYCDGSKLGLKSVKYTVGDTVSTKATWDMATICGGTITVTPKGDNKAGTITVTVDGPRVGSVVDTTKTPIEVVGYADELSVTMYRNGGVVETQSSVLSGTSHSFTFTPPATDDYTFKAVAKRSKETTTLDSAETSPVAFILPLETPVISSAASNGLETGKDTASVTVMWGKVPEATDYQVQYRVKGATDWTAGEKFAATASTVTHVVTGLAVDTEYEYQAKAFRDTEETGWSETFEATTTATKQTPWTEIVFGTSTTDASNSIVGGNSNTANFDYTNNLGWGAHSVSQDGHFTFSVTDSAGNTRTEEYGSGTEDDPVLTGDLNTDPLGRILLSSRDGAGKITEQSSDGMLLYYTPIPAGTNYRLKADVHVIDWNTRDSQNGFGVVAMDRVESESWTGKVSDNAGNFWNNSYMAGAARQAFYYDVDTGTPYSEVDKGADAYTKYSYYIGLTSVAKTGIPMTANGPYSASSNPTNFSERRFPLDTRIPKNGVKTNAGGNTNRVNTIGNYSTKPAGFSLLDDNSAFMKNYEITDFTVEIRKNNTGYVTTIWDADGYLLGSNTEYFVKGAMELSGDTPYHSGDVSGRKDIPEIQQCLDSDYEYVGLFTSRDAEVLFSNVELTTLAPEDDDPAVLPPTLYVTPKMSISSGDSSNSPDFKLSITANVDGTATVTQNGAVVAKDVPVIGDYRCDVAVTLKSGSNTFSVSFQPDGEQELGAFTELANTQTLTASSVVKYEGYYGEMNNLYVSPTGTSTAYGTRNRPLDVYTAISVVRPGQNIILLPGVYNLSKTIKINRGMDGTEAEPIYFMGDPDRAEGEKVVLNGQGKSGSVLVQGSDWWIFQDFEVVGSSNNSTAFQISGSHNIVQRVDTHDNGSSGLAISRLSSSDHIPVRDPSDPEDQSLVEDWGDWPCFNTIINCSSYRNYDTGYQGADGFCAKIYAGEGNVFDGCVAYWNADDGWDLYAKTGEEEGVIGAVTLRNCITFENGYEVRVLADAASQTPEYEADGYTPVLDRNEDGTVKLTPAGNGNGFKLGGSHLPGPHSISNSYAFYNKCKGFDSNNGSNIQISGCTSYNNGEENVGLSTSYKVIGYLVEKTVSFKDDNAPLATDGKTVKMSDGIPSAKSSQTDMATYDDATYYKWTYNATTEKGASATASGSTVTADNFVSLLWNNSEWADGAQRDENGSLDLGDFLKLTGISNAGAGSLDNSSATVATPEIVADPEPVTGGGGGSTGGGTIADKTTDVTDTGSTTTPVETQDTFTAKSSTNDEGDKTITVTKDKTDEVVAEVTIPATIPTPETKFDDVPEGHWAEESINNMAGLGIVKGVGNNQYDMDSAVTRGTIATMLFRFANGKEGKKNTFADVAAGQWYTDAIAWAADVGVVTGYSDTTFGPDDTITREQLAVMLWRFAKLIGMDGTADASLDGYGDAGSVNDWAKDGMTWCVEKGIINGVSADTLSPSTSATRAQTATMLDRFIGLMK